MPRETSHKGSLVPSFVAHYYLNDKLYLAGNFGRGPEFRGCFLGFPIPLRLVGVLAVRFQFSVDFLQAASLLLGFFFARKLIVSFVQMPALGFNLGISVVW